MSNRKKFVYVISYGQRAPEGYGALATTMSGNRMWYEIAPLFSTAFETLEGAARFLKDGGFEFPEEEIFCHFDKTLIKKESSDSDFIEEFGFIKRLKLRG